MGYVSVARIKKLVHTGKQLYLCTCPGDGLSNLPESFEALAVPGDSSPHQPPLGGFTENNPGGTLASIRKQGAVASGKARLQIHPSGSSKGDSTPNETMDLSGHWLFVDQELLESRSAEEEVFLYELKSFACRDLKSGQPCGPILDYRETGAHGILEVEWQNRSLLVPLTDEHVRIRRKEGMVEFTDLSALDPDAM